MERAKQGHGVYRGLVNFARENAALIQKVLEQIREHGPAGAGDVESAIERGPVDVESIDVGQRRPGNVKRAAQEIELCGGSADIRGGGGV